MSDIKVDGATNLEQLKARVESKFGHVSKAETVEELIADVERVSRFIIVPPEFMAMLRDVAASYEKHGAESLLTSLKIQGVDPAWADLIEAMDELTDFEELRSRLTELVSFQFRTRTFRTLLTEVKKVGRVTEIPDEFIRRLEEIIEMKEAREAEVRAQAAATARLANIEGTDHDYTRGLVALARGEGLDVSGSSTASELMERLRMLGAVHSGLRGKLEPFEAKLREKKLGEYDTGQSVDYKDNEKSVESDNSGEPKRIGEGRQFEDSNPVPTYVRSFISIKGIEWGEDKGIGSIANRGDELMMSAYGYAIFGTKRIVNFGSPADPGISAFLLADPSSSMVSVGKLPYVESMEDALERIAKTYRITKLDMGRDPATVPAHTKVTARYRAIERLRSSSTPHEIELKRIRRQIAKLELSIEGFAAGAAFFSGRPGKKDFGAPPAQVIAMLGALRSVGIDSVRIGMYSYPERGSGDLIYSAKDGILRVGREILLDLNKNGAVDVKEILAISSSVADELDDDWRFIETIETYHLPLAVGLWGDSPAQFKRKMKGVIKTASKKDGPAREKYLLRTYSKWHSLLSRNFSVKKGAGIKSSRKGGGGGSVRGIARGGPLKRAEIPKAIMAMHHEGDPSAIAAVSGAAINTGALPLAVYTPIVI